MKISDIAEICRKKYVYGIVLFFFVCVGITKADINPIHKTHCAPPCCQKVNAGQGTATTGLLFFCSVEQIKCYAYCKVNCSADYLDQGRQCGQGNWDICDMRCINHANPIPPESPNICDNPIASDCRSVYNDLGIQICLQAACLELNLSADCSLSEEVM